MKVEELFPDKTEFVRDEESAALVESLGLPDNVLEIDPHEPLQQVTRIHMVAAWMFAHGSDVTTVSVASGIKTELLKLYLSSSKEFIKLVKGYQENPEEKPDYQPRQAANLALAEAVDVLLRRVSSEPEVFSNRDLLSVIDMLSVRTDLGLNPKEPEKDDKLTAEEIAKIKAACAPENGNEIPLIEEVLASRGD